MTLGTRITASLIYMYIRVSCVHITQLKNFIQRASFDPEIDNNYFARAEENDENILTRSTAKYIISFYVIGFVFALIITITLLVIYLNTKRWDRKLKRTAKSKKANKYTKSKIFSIAATTFFITVYALVLDGFALYITTKPENVTIDEPYVNALPGVVTGIDIAAALYWIICWTLSLCSWLCGVYDRRIKNNDEEGQTVTCNDFITQQIRSVDLIQWFAGREYLFLALSTLGPVTTLVIHLPYIVIAYLNDAAYATSIFIYYTITAFVLFGVLDLTYGTCQGAIINADLRERGLEPPRQVQDCFCCCPRSGTKRRAVFIIAIPTFAFITLILAGMITAVLVVVPISRAFSDAPNRLLGFYQTAIVLVGAYVLYRTFFKKKPSLASVVKDREDYIPTKKTTDDADWDLLSNDDKVAEFYTRFIDIVANYPNPPSYPPRAPPPPPLPPHPPQARTPPPPQAHTVPAPTNQPKGAEKEPVKITTAAEIHPNSDDVPLLQSDK